MPGAGSEKELVSGLGEGMPITGEMPQSPVALKARWSKKRKVKMVIPILRGEPLVAFQRELREEVSASKSGGTKPRAGMEADLRRTEGARFR